MLAEIGYGILVVAFVVALYSVGAAIYGERTEICSDGRIWPGGPCCCYGRSSAWAPPRLIYSADHKSLRGLVCLSK